jgi:hypothetical protein
MSAIEMVIEKVKRLDEQHARQLLNLLQAQESVPVSGRQPTGAMAMLGFARKFRTAPRPTADWMNDLRAGERE